MWYTYVCFTLTIIIIIIKQMIQIWPEFVCLLVNLKKEEISKILWIIILWPTLTVLYRILESQRNVKAYIFVFINLCFNAKYMTKWQ